MKKILILVVCFVITLSASGCEKNSIFQFGESTDEIFLYSTAEDNYILNDMRSTSFDMREYKDLKADREKNFTICDRTYTAIYKNSAVLPTSDLSVHVYKIEELDNSKVYVDAITGKVVKYINIPYDGTKMTCEDDYIDFIKTFSKVSEYSNYEYKCMTHCYYTSEKEFRSKMEQGFLSASKNRSIQAHYFFYKQSVDEIKTNDHVSAIFQQETFTLEIYDINYTDDDFELFRDSYIKHDECIEAYVASTMRSEYNFISCDIENKSFFVQDGVPYVLMNVTINFSQKGDSDRSQFSTSVQLISGLDHS